MDQSQQLTQLIERAVDNGWVTLWEYFTELGQTVQISEDEVYIAYEQSWRIETILFGDNLSFLKALVGSETVKLFGADLPKDVWIAQVLIAKTDACRIPWLYEQVIGENR